MNTLTILLDGAPQQGGSSMGMIMMMLLIFIIMYFFMIRPQQKKQKELQKFQNSVTPGTQIITQGGVLGTVKSIDEAENTVKVEVASGVCIMVARNSVFPIGEAPADKK